MADFYFVICLHIIFNILGENWVHLALKLFFVNLYLVYSLSFFGAHVA